MKSLMSVVFAASVLQTAFAEELPRIELRDYVKRGNTISVALKNGRRVAGTVGDAQWDGFWIEHPPKSPSFVGFRSANIVLDPDTGTAIGVVEHVRDGASWVEPTVIIAVTAFAVAVVATKGLFPVCFFVTCFR